MGRLITNSPKPVVRVKVAQTNYKGILALALTVQAGLTAHAGFYASPVPSLVDFGTDITALETALKSLGSKFNKGGSAAVVAVKNAAFTVFTDLTSLAFYVQEIISADDPAPLQKVQVSWSGFATKSPKSRIDRMQFVRNVHQSNNKQFPVTLRRIAWRRSLGMFSGVRAKSYNIYYVSTAGTGLLTSVTKTNFIVPFTAPDGTNPITSIIIKPVNAQGEGNGHQIFLKG
jgi:hypothetical protein